MTFEVLKAYYKMTLEVLIEITKCYCTRDA